MVESFSESEKKILLRFCSNIDKPIFVLKNLPEAVKGALFSRYSRSAKGLRRLLLDEFIQNPDLDFQDIVEREIGTGMDALVATKKADTFYARVLDGFGDDSVGELGGAHVAIEDVSNIATKVLEDARLGGSPLEKSSRYVFFDQKENGEYRFLREPTIMASEFADDYLQVNNLLFDTYSKLVQPVSHFFEEHFPIENFSFIVDYTTKEEQKFPTISDETIQKRAQNAYHASIRAKTCDVLRYLLPVSTLTNLGIFGNGRFFEYLLRKLYSNPLKEMNQIADCMHTELNTVIQPFVRRAKPDSYLSDLYQESRNHIQKIVPPEKTPSNSVSLVHFDPNAEEKVLTHALFEHSRLSLEQCQKMVSTLSSEEKAVLLKTIVGKRRTRRDKPSRAFENAFYTFSLLGDYGMYRDLQRHRVLTQQRQEITVAHGFETPAELITAGFEKDFVDALKSAEDLYNRMYPKLSLEAQYVVPFAYRIQWYITMNLREAFHFMELRSSKQGHPSYRRMTQQMYHEIEKVHPTLAKLLQFVDLNSYDLARIDAEMRSQHKKGDREKESKAA
ncbi:FAD-dependent thymidylate synthase [Candidatus Micrarchaeota archaeon]|nr:FAD-dependent thymidylate synthase [Candidatus Micrarchaeota archaeon]MBU1930244.1 FAD-dependent thymidylate synthase [Candidatus Micrarchaeota archaeon]